MRSFFIILSLTLVSCSTTRNNLPESRDPSSVPSGSCQETLQAFFDSHESKSTKESFSEAERAFLKNEILVNSLPKDSSEKEQIEISYLLIKKKFPHFDEEQVLAHFELLKNSCGI